MLSDKRPAEPRRGGMDGWAAYRAGGTLVGRTEELAALETALHTVVGGRALAVLVGGDAGIGKSRLIEEFCDQARLRDATVAVGSCVPPRGGLAYAPVFGFLRGLAGVAPQAADLAALAGGDSDRARAETLTEADERPAFAGLTAAISQGSLGYARTTFFEAILQLLLAIAQQSPLVLVVEDVQWCDADSALFIDYLARNLGDARVLLICSYRSEELGPGHPLAGWFAELSRGSRATQVSLRGLDRPAIAALLADAAGRQPSPEVADVIWRRSQGNPFFAKELLAVGAATQLPAALSAVVLTRVRQLSAGCQQLVGIVAAAGAAAGHELLLAVTASPAELLERELQECIEHNVLGVDPETSTYHFRHALLREAVYASMLPAQRRAVHRRIATALAGDPLLGGEMSRRRVAELAGQWWAAGDWDAALRPSIEAADAAARALAFHEADTHYGHALTAWERGATADDTAGVSRIQLLERAAECAYFAGANQRASELARKAIAETMLLGDKLSAARCYVLVSRCAWGLGDSEAAFEAIGAALDLLPPDAPTAELALALAEQARAFMLMSQFRTGAALAHRAIAVAHSVGARAVEGHARNTLGCCVGSNGEFDAGIAMIRAAVEVAEELQLPEDLNRGYGNLSYLYCEAGRLEDAIGLVYDAAAVGEDLGGIRLNSAVSNSIEPLRRLGRWEEAEAALEQLGLAPYGACVASPYTDRLPYAIWRGRFADAEDLLATARELTADLGDVQFSVVVARLEAELRLEQGHARLALELVRDAMRLATHSDDESVIIRTTSVAARAASDCREMDRISGRDLVALREELDGLVSHAESLLLARQARKVSVPGYLAALLALCHAERSRLDHSDPELWRRAVEALDAAPDVYLAAYARWREAEALVESHGSRAHAADCLSVALEHSHRLGTTPLTKRIDELATRARLELQHTSPREQRPNSTTASELGLTAREAEILGYLASGDNDRQIAEALFISKKTVSVHVSNVLRKLQVANRVEAGKIGQRHGARPITRHVASDPAGRA